MKNMRLVYLTVFTTALIYSCNNKDTPLKEIIKADKLWLDSIIHKSDTSWIKPYRNNSFVTSEYYVDRKDSIVTQLMKDSAGTVRQITIAKYDNYRLFFAEYYANGQLMAHLPLDSKGKYDGLARLYFETGVVKSEGAYQHGFYTGKWVNFDINGKKVSTDEYNQNGQLVKTTSQ
jgi:antitoxin component YwqK of YwqJK toxin-antitoxin module